MGSGPTLGYRLHGRIHQADRPLRYLMGSGLPSDTDCMAEYTRLTDLSGIPNVQHRELAPTFNMGTWSC